MVIFFLVVFVLDLYRICKYNMFKCHHTWICHHVYLPGVFGTGRPTVSWCFPPPPTSLLLPFSSVLRGGATPNGRSLARKGGRPPAEKDGLQVSYHGNRCYTGSPTAGIAPMTSPTRASIRLARSPRLSFITFIPLLPYFHPSFFFFTFRYPFSCPFLASSCATFSALFPPASSLSSPSSLWPIYPHSSIMLLSISPHPPYLSFSYILSFLPSLITFPSSSLSSLLRRSLSLAFLPIVIPFRPFLFPSPSAAFLFLCLNMSFSLLSFP